MKVSEVGEWAEREGGRGKEMKAGRSILESKTFEVLFRETKGGGREMSTLLELLIPLQR